MANCWLYWDPVAKDVCGLGERSDLDGANGPCHCFECSRLKAAAKQLDDLNCYADDEAANAVLDAKWAIWDARKTLHRLHKPNSENARLYYAESSQRYKGPPHESLFSAARSHRLYGGEISGRVQEDSDYQSDYTCEEDIEEYCTKSEDEVYWYGCQSDVETDLYASENEESAQKFMVCDHCRGHGLPCNESPICFSCEYSGTPCIHRWRPDSPHSIAECPNPNCRYAHEDYLPMPPSIVHELYSLKDYIILPGKLRGYLLDGKVNVAARQGSYLDSALAAIPRQVTARADFDRWIREGAGRLDTLYCHCGDGCGKTHAVDEETADYDDSCDW